MKNKFNLNFSFLIVLTPLVLALFISCSSVPNAALFESNETVKNWDVSVDETIAEPKRAEKLKTLGHQLIEVSNTIQNDIATFDKQVMALNDNYAATHEEFQQLLKQFSEKRKPNYIKYRNILFAIRSEVNADEWKALNN